MSQIVNYPVYINSKNRINQNQPSNIARFKFTDLVTLQSRKKIWLSVPYVFIPPTWLNIWSYNNTVTIYEATYPGYTGVLSYLVTIPAGNYNVDSFGLALTSAMTAESASVGYGLTYGYTYNAGTGTLTIFIVGSPSNRSFTYSFTTNDLKNFLGFNDSYDNLTVPFPAQLSPAQPNYSYTSPNPVNFQAAVPAVYIRTTILNSNTTYDTNIQGLAGDIIRIVPIEGDTFSVIQMNNFQGLDQQRLEVTNNLMNTDVIFSLTTDDPNQAIQLSGYDWQMELLVQYTRETK